MKTNIKIPANSTRTRVLSAFMAFLIFTLTFQQAFVNMGISVHAEDVDYSISATTTKSNYMGKAGHTTSVESAYTYTGTVKPVTVSMYDYLTDGEISASNANWNKLNDDNYTWYSFYNPFNTFDKAISDENVFLANTVYSPAEDNITIEFVSAGYLSNVYVYLCDENSSHNYSKWPGMKMTADSDHKVFTYTVRKSDVPFESPKLIFNGGSGSWQTVDITPDSWTENNVYSYKNYYEDSNTNKTTVTLTKPATRQWFSAVSDNCKMYVHSWDGTATATSWPGNEMAISGNVASINYSDGVPANIIFNCRRYSQSQSKYIEDWKTNDIGMPMVLGYDYSFFMHIPDSGNYGGYLNVFPFESTTTVQDIISKHYKTPLYFGLFLQPDENYYANIKPDTGSSATSSYSDTNQYSNFWWQANMAQRKQGVEGSTAPSASIRELVDKELYVDPTTKERKLMQNGKELPYFSSTWADSHKSNGSTGNDIMRYWKSTEDSKISFPFYEVVTDTSNAEDYVPGTNDTSVTPEKARYYQFDCKDSTVLFDTDTSKFKERDPSTQRIRGTSDKPGFFPFTDTDSYDGNNVSTNGKKNNYGFGAKFEMTFKLNPDGKVETVQANGDPIEGAGRVNTRFEFTGDDDLWVFIDDNLVLDMGGAHSKSSGHIDFAKKEAVADSAMDFGTNGRDNVYGNGTKKEVKGTAFTSLIDGYSSAKGYDDTTHTMTIFYMERGMSESNLKIRYNFPVKSNFSKMKIKEQTVFSNVNDGLKDLTQKAAENDVFQYTVKNQGTDKAHVLQSNTKYPTKTNYVRTVQGINTKLASEMTSGTPASSYFQPANKTDNYEVGNVSYNWVDEYAGMTSKVGAGGITDENGKLYLLHGVPKVGSTSEVKSSAEFEGQFDRYSLMQISQADQLYKPNAHTNLDSADAATLSNTYSGRLVSDYYTTERSIFSTINKTPVAIGDNVQFSFRNDIDPTNLILGSSTPDANTTSSVQMTELFVNTVKTGNLSVTKKKTGLTTNAQNTEYSFQLTLTDLFGNTVDDYADLTGSDYEGIVISKSGVAGTSTLGTSGTFTLKARQTATIKGIPYGTKFTISEAATNLGSGTNYNDTTITTSGNPDTTITGRITSAKTISNDSVTVTVTNNFNESLDVSVKKTNSGGDGLPGAEIELWYKETTTPQSYSFNNPQIVPNKVNGMTVSKTAAQVGIPGLQESESTYDTYTVSNTYDNPTVPSSSDTDWILPRNDTDYIYFRDYNTGTYTGEWDNTSFTKNSDDSNNDNETDKRTWRETNFAKKKAATSSDPGTHNQTLELGFTNGNQWFAAEFSGSGKKTVRYAMWERFVDEYNDEKTVVWKIQPPDGYDTVHFMLMDGDTCIRKTLPITYELGKIYHKTSWGGYWTSQDGKNCYYDVPYADEGYWAPHDDTAQVGGIYDQRDNDSTMLQARKYIPTEQKIIFHCNSDDVWHNIHIEFFSDTTGTTRVEGQAFPGYMMEPYAYAGNDYRTDDGYLTYELTIPKGAKSFRITNGESTTEIYGYYTAVTQLLNQTAKKNYGNYFHFKTYNQKGGILEQWTTPPEEGNTTGIPDHTYTTTDITSDCDYIYFEKPSSDWGDNVYAYFYGGGNLRDDNWQRACYSSWPGIAPVGTEYDSVYSNTYSISTSGNKYNGTGVTTSTISPESYYTAGGKKIYKFCLPKGDAKNYSKVIFNDGLSGGHETGVIAYKAGCIYDKSGNETKHYDKTPTEIYSVRTNSNYSSDDKTEYIYIKNSRNWDDLHITFYDSDGNQILQGGCGYIMDYAGKQSEGSPATYYEYYRMPIPESAVKFSVNNGIGTTPTENYDIIRIEESATDAKPTNTKSAEDMFVYDFATDTTLTRVGYTEGTPTRVPVTTTTGQTESTSDYTSGIRKTGTTDDTLNIRDDFAWDVPIGGVNVTFYGSTGTVVGSGVMMKTNADSDRKVWYTKKIPSGAESFSVSYTKVVSSTPTTTTTANYPIYKAATPDTNGNVTTSGNMYYKTAGDNKLSVIYTESTYNEADDETYQQRGDYLYLKCLTSEKDTYWKDMKVTFYANGDNIIRSDVTAKFINNDTDGVNSWYRVSIPTGAETFTVTGTKVSDSTTHTTDRADIYELKSKYSRYEENYTLGNMQYELPSDGNGSKADLLYPKFTKDDEYTLEVSTGNTISSAGSIVPVDTSAVSGYAAASAATAEKSSSVPNPQQALYETDTNTISYTWSNSSASDDMLRFVKPDGWSDPSAQFYNGDTTVGANTGMTLDSGSTYKVSVPATTYDSVVFSAGANSSPKINLTSYNGGKNYVCSYGGTTTGEFTDGKVRFDNSSLGWSNVYIRYWNSSGSEPSSEHPMVNNGSEIYEYEIPNPSNYNRVRFLTKSNGSVTLYTLDLSKDNGGANAIFTPNIDDSNIYFRVASGTWSRWSNKIYAYYYTGSTPYADWDDVGGANRCPEHVKDDDKRIHFNISNVNNSGTYSTLIIHGYDNNSSTSADHNWQTEDIDVSGTPKNGGGRIYQIWATNSSNGTAWDNLHVVFLGYGSSPESSGSWSNTGTTSIWTLTPVFGSSLTATYQPEDRYGMISDLNSDYDPVTQGDADTDNFIYISTAISDPYIMFYSDTAGAAANKIGGSGMATTGISLKNATLDGVEVATSTGTENLYKIRLPKDAQSFRISNGSTTLGSTVTLIKETIYVKNADGTLCESTETAPHTTLTNYRHAGTTFVINSSGAVDTTYSSDGFVKGKKLCSDMTYNKQPITDPLNPRTDGDYIFFTDTDNTFGGTDSTKTVYAYYYGGADGEYTAWPGIKASTADTAPLVYTDNEGRKVYMFQLPELSNGKYPYVIFNNGSANSRKVTQAISIMNSTQTAYTAGGNNYTLDTSGTNNQHYGTYDSTASSTNYVTAYPTSSQSKIISDAADYSTGGTGRYIYIINNGTTTNTAGTGRTIFDDMHVMFYDAEQYPIGSYTPGYKPDKLSSQTYTATGDESTANGTAGDGDIYRIQVPSNAVYFQINNGTKAGTTNDNERQSEIKAITANALYRFVPKATNANDYISETNVPTKQSDAHFLLDIVNRITTSEEENSESSTVDIHIATVVTGANGTIDHIKWLKNSMTDIDSTYLANTDGSGTVIKVKKDGDYYWKEVVAPSGYKVNPNVTNFSTVGYSASNVPTITDEANPTGSLTLNKKLYAVDSRTNSGESKSFTFNVTLVAPVGTKWETLNSSSSPLTFQTKTGSADAITVGTDTTPIKTSDITDGSYSNDSLTHTISVKLPATGTTDFIIGNIPSGTAYSVTETALTDYSSTPVSISEAMYKTENSTTSLVTETVEDMDGTIPSYTDTTKNVVKYVVTNKREVGSLTLAKTVTGDAAAIAAAGINQNNTYTDFTYTVKLTAPTETTTPVDLRDYLLYATLTNSSGFNATLTKVNDTAVSGTPADDYNSATAVTSIEFTVAVKANNGSKTIGNLPMGTGYTVEEGTLTYDSGITWTKSGEVTSSDNKSLTTDEPNPVVTITNNYTDTSNPPTPSSSKVILTKTAKEQVGNTKIGDKLGNAKFLLYKNDGDNDDSNDTLAGNFTQSGSEYNYGGSGTVNTDTNYLVTGNDSSDTTHFGKLILNGLPVGDYYLQEEVAPNGFSNMDSNTGKKKRVYFSVGDNTVTKNIICSDEMDAAYIRLFEHISEKKAAWGDPTFIFKITNTASGAKASYVALTVNDDGTITDTTNHRVLKWIDSGTEQPFTADPIDNTLYENWLVEATSETEYKGMYHIDSQGRIKVEPGTYSITRVPVSRYQFVTSGHVVYTTDNEPGAIDANDITTGTETAETVTLTAGQTGDIHYYDKVGYYDKFSQVDTEVNKFYKLENGANKTIKGIRIAYYHSTATSGELALTGSALTIYAIYADGTERELNSTEKAKITFSYTNVDDKPAPFTPDISSDSKTLTVSDVTTYTGNVYTITATYPYDSGTNFTAKFDLVFSRT